MRCCASSTISIARDRQSGPAPRTVAEAALFAAALRPLASSLGFLGELVVDAVARDLVIGRESSGTDARS